LSVTSLAPNKGVVGATVVINGFGFDAAPSGNDVSFNGAAATVLDATPSSIVVTIPAGATSGPVVVETSGGSDAFPGFAVLSGEEVPKAVQIGLANLGAVPRSLAVTPDELGPAWQGGRVHLTLQSVWNGRQVGLTEAGPEMTFHFGQLIAHVAKTRRLRAGSIVGSGTVSRQPNQMSYTAGAVVTLTANASPGWKFAGWTGDVATNANPLALAMDRAYSVTASFLWTSTVPEVIVAVHAGMRVLGLSIVTDICFPDTLKPANIEEIIATANGAEPNLRKIVLGVLAREAAEA
jgi:hypothetical protein